MNDNVIHIKPNPKFVEFLKKLKSFPILFALLLLIAPTCFYSVNADEDAVVLRFGKYSKTTGPGLHLKLPGIKPFFEIETVKKVPVRKIHKLEVGFRTLKAGVQTRYEKSSRFDTESIMLTGDLNVADVEWIVQFQISDAKDYLFNVRNVPVNLYDLSQAVMREVVGDRTVTEVLTTGRLEIENQAFEEMQKILNEYHMGISLVALKLQDVNPPDVVKPSFNEVNNARQEAEQMVNDAWKGYNKIIPEAKGKADKAVADAQAYKTNLVNRSKGDAKRFTEFYKEYRKAPDVTKKRLYYEKMRNVIKRAQSVYVIDNDIKSMVPLVNVSQREQ